MRFAVTSTTQTLPFSGFSMSLMSLDTEASRDDAERPRLAPCPLGDGVLTADAKIMRATLRMTKGHHGVSHISIHEIIR